MSRKSVPRFMVNLKEAFDRAHQSGMNIKQITEEINGKVTVEGKPIRWSAPSVRSIMFGGTHTTRHPREEVHAVTKHFSAKFRTDFETTLMPESPQLVITLSHEEALALATGVVTSEDLSRLVHDEIKSKVLAKLEQASMPTPK